MYTYDIGYYVREEFFNDIVKVGNGNVLVHCLDDVTMNDTYKYEGVWHLYVNFHETNKWHPLVKTKSINKRIVYREFVSVEGVISTLLRLDFPMVSITRERGSGCEISRDGNIYYRPMCDLIK